MLQAIVVVVGGVLLVLAATVLMALFGGTLVFWLWPVVMVPVFHMPELTWVQAVALTWICGILIKASQSNTNKAS